MFSQGLYIQQIFENENDSSINILHIPVNRDLLLWQFPKELILMKLLKRWHNSFGILVDDMSAFRRIENINEYSLYA